MPAQSAASSAAGPTVKDTRTRILDAAITLFAESSPKKVGIVDVAAAVGLSGPALYRYFRNRHDLYVAAVEEDLNRLLFASLRSVRSTPAPLIAGTWWPALIAAAQSHPLSVAAVLARDPTVLDVLSESEGVKLVEAALIADLRASHAAGILRQDIDFATLAPSMAYVVYNSAIPLIFAGKYNTPDWFAVLATVLAAGLYPVPNWSDPEATGAFVGAVMSTGLNPIIEEFFAAEDATVAESTKLHN
jgi:AcrR family transcriptional regulator